MRFDSPEFRVKVGLAEMLKGGVIMDVTDASQASIAEEAGAAAVMALERVPADIRAEGGVKRLQFIGGSGGAQGQMREAVVWLPPGYDAGENAGKKYPVLYMFDLDEAAKSGRFDVRYKIPHADVDVYTREEHARLFGPDAPLEWSHTLDEQIGGQLEAGFLLAGLYEDRDPGEKLSQYTPLYLATRAIKS